MNNERCSYHSGNSKSFRNSVSGTGDENQKCISYCITISFPHEKHYYLLLQDLNQSKKSRPTGLTPSSVCSAPAVLAHFPLLSPQMSCDLEIPNHTQFPKPVLLLQAFRNLLLCHLNVLSSSSPPLVGLQPPTLSSGKTREMVGADTFTLQW